MKCAEEVDPKMTWQCLHRAAMSKGGEVPVDLLKDFHCAQTTLGFRIGVKSIDGRLMSCVVQQVRGGGGYCR